METTRVRQVSSIPFVESIIDLEDAHPELLDSSAFADRSKQTLGATITITYNGSYVNAAAHADGLVIKALDLAGIRYADQHVVDADGPRSLALT